MPVDWGGGGGGGGSRRDKSTLNMDFVATVFVNNLVPRLSPHSSICHY